MREIGTGYYQGRFAFCAFEYCFRQPAACGRIGFSHNQRNELESGQSYLKERQFGLHGMLLPENIRQVLYARFAFH